MSKPRDSPSQYRRPHAPKARRPGTPYFTNKANVELLPWNSQVSHSLATLIVNICEGWHQVGIHGKVTRRCHSRVDNHQNSRYHHSEHVQATTNTTGAIPTLWCSSPSHLHGDFNSGHTDWGHKSCNQDSEFQVDWASASDATLLFDPKEPATFLSGRWKTETNPDLDLATLDDDKRSWLALTVLEIYAGQQAHGRRRSIVCSSIILGETSFAYLLHDPQWITTKELVI